MLLFLGLTVLHFLHFSALPSRPASRVQAHQLFETLARAVVAAGSELVLLQGSSSSASPGGVQLSTTAYPDGSPELHTVADKSSAAVLARVALAFPGLALVNEEDVASGALVGWRPTQPARGEALEAGASTTSGQGLAAPRAPTLPLAELAVFLDPLDASQEYSEGLWDYVTVSACVTRCGVPIVGLIYQPFQQRLYWTRPGTAVNVAFSAADAVEAERALPNAWLEAAAGEGAGSGGCCRQRQASGRGNSSASGAAAAAALGGLRAVISRSHAAKASTEALRAALPPDATISPAGGAGFKFIQVLEGAADAYLHAGGIRKWDVCAGEALVAAAGGSVRQWDGQGLDYCLPALPATAPPARLEGLVGGATGAAGGEAALAARKSAVEKVVRVNGLVVAKSSELGEALGGALPATF